MKHQGEPRRSSGRNPCIDHKTVTHPDQYVRFQRERISGPHPPRLRVRCLTRFGTFFAVLLLATLTMSVHAEAMFGPHTYEAKTWTGDAFGEVMFDRSAPPLISEMRLKDRNAVSVTSLPSSIAAPTTTTTGKSFGTATQTIQTASQAPQAPLPIPFDANVGANFSSPSCATFFQNFLQDPAFLACHPLSLMLQTSSSFFAATRSLTRLTQTLDASCNANFASCSSLMSNLARQVKSSSNCQEDAAMGNPVVTQAYNGFTAYEPLYRAGCLRSQTSGGYCFADAISNTTAPTSSYVYYLPLGVNLPAGTRPPCDTCLQNTMAIFQGAASSPGSLLATTYGPAAQMIDIGCGPTFVAASVQSGSTSVAPTGGLLIAVMTLMTMMVLTNLA